MTVKREQFMNLKKEIFDYQILISVVTLRFSSTYDMIHIIWRLVLRWDTVGTLVENSCIFDNPKTEQVRVRLLIEIPIRQNHHQRHLSYRQFIRQIIFVRFRWDIGQPVQERNRTFRNGSLALKLFKNQVWSRNKSIFKLKSWKTVIFGQKFWLKI